MGSRDQSETFSLVGSGCTLVHSYFRFLPFVLPCYLCMELLTQLRCFRGTRTLLNMLKGMIGPGCLSLPLAFKFCGLWVRLAVFRAFALLDFEAELTYIVMRCERSGVPGFGVVCISLMLTAHDIVSNQS